MSRTPNRGHDIGYGRPMPWVDMAGGPTLGELDPARWHPRALCGDSSTWAWFGDSKTLRHRDAVRTCLACPVRRTCLASSLVYAEEFGIWGGLTASRRVPLLNALAAGARLVDVLDSVTRLRRRAA
jgi:WhiB family redox-sensing transcriptional regulator